MQLASGQTVLVKNKLFKKLQWTVVRAEPTRITVNNPKVGDRTFNAAIVRPILPLPDLTPLPPGNASPSMPVEPSLAEDSLCSLVKEEYPGMTHWGWLGSVDGSWASARDWKCESCNGKRRLVIWNQLDIIGKPCLECLTDKADSTPKPPLVALPPECPLTEERDRLLQSELAPQGAWIETCKVSAGFRQAFWRSRSAMFDGKKRKYIGKADGPEHQRASTSVSNRNRLVALEKQLKLLEVAG